MLFHWFKKKLCKFNIGLSNLVVVAEHVIEDNCCPDSFIMAGDNFKGDSKYIKVNIPVDLFWNLFEVLTFTLIKLKSSVI